MAALSWRQASIAATAALIVAVVVLGIMLASGALGTGAPDNQPVGPVVEATVPSGSAAGSERSTPTQATPRASTCDLYGGSNNLPILDTRRCLASDHVVTAE